MTLDQREREELHILRIAQAQREAEDARRIDKMWELYTVGRILVPLLLAMQPVLIVFGVWLIRELSS